MIERENKKHLPVVGIYFIALMLGSGLSFVFATYWLEVSSGWLALLVGAVFSIIGAFLGESVVDAIMFSLFVGIIVTVFYIAGPEIAILRAGIIPMVTGLCVGKLVAGIFEEVSS
jgi:hypothetical protein